MQQDILMTSKEAYSAAIRVMDRCDILSEFSESLNGLTRTYLSQPQVLTNSRVGEWMQMAGMNIWSDAVGNICGRYESIQSSHISSKFPPSSPALLLGSHLDTVPNAGRYDGILGVLSAIEIVQWFYERQLRLPLAIETIGFCDEEGTRFGITMLGSRGITGTWKKDWIIHPDNNGITIAEAMKMVGLDAEKIYKASREVKDIVAYLELHIEQGPCLETEGCALGVVTAINGALRLNCKFIGKAGHAGTTPMVHRNDALVAASEWIISVEQITRNMDPCLVGTVGCLHCLPGTANVIPGEVNLSLDLRGPKDDVLQYLLSEILLKAKQIANRRKINFHFDEYYRISSTVCDKNLQKFLNEAVEVVQGRTITLSSGAGHDAMVIAERWPVGMLFVRNYKGISHHPSESIQISDVALALQAYLQTVYNFANEYLVISNLYSLN